jgi:FkbM family methyltransferase
MTATLANYLNGAGRSVQNLLGPRATRFAQAALGHTKTRFIRELLGRNPRHRVQISLPVERVGAGVASWVVHPNPLNENSIVYSLGVGDDIVFDLDLIERYRLNVFAFDPTPLSIAWIGARKLPPQFHFFDFGIGREDGILAFFSYDGTQFTVSAEAGADPLNAVTDKPLELPVSTLRSAMNRLGHNKIDLLKINIEGSEYGVLENMLATDIAVDQIVVEFHHRFPGFSVSQTKAAVKSLNDRGYKIFHISDIGRHYSFLRV